MSGEVTAQAESTAGAATARTIVENFGRQVSTRPDAPAMYFRTGQRYTPISWGEFAKGVRRLAAYLIAEGVAQQEHVAIWSGNRPEWHVADMAILSARCRPVPVYLTLSADQAKYVLAHSQTRVAFVEGEEQCARSLAPLPGLPSYGPDFSACVNLPSNQVQDVHGRAYDFFVPAPPSRSSPRPAAFRATRGRGSSGRWPAWA